MGRIRIVTDAVEKLVEIKKLVESVEEDVEEGGEPSARRKCGQWRANGGRRHNTRRDDCGVVRMEMIVLQCERQV